MAKVHGRSGRLYVGLASDTVAAEPVTDLTKWNVQFTTPKVDVTAMGDPNKNYLAGLADAAGTFAGFYDNASAQLYTASQDGLARRFYLYPTTANTGQYWYGTGLFDFSVDSGVDQAINITGNWAAASPITKVG